MLFSELTLKRFFEFGVEQRPLNAAIALHLHPPEYSGLAHPKARLESIPSSHHLYASPLLLYLNIYTHQKILSGIHQHHLLHPSHHRASRSILDLITTQILKQQSPNARQH